MRLLAISAECETDFHDFLYCFLHLSRMYDATALYVLSISTRLSLICMYIKYAPVLILTHTIGMPLLLM